MGCAQSKIDNEESVSRCKDRKILMKDAVVARNAFAAGHTGYAVALKNVGAALSDYGHGEAEEGHEVEQQLHQPLDATPPPPPPPPSSIDNLPPPPPPLPNFSPSPIKRAVSMPAIPITNRKHPHGMDHITIAEEGEEEEEEQEEVVEEALHRNSEKLKNKQNVVNGAHEEVTPLRTPEVSPMPNMAWDYFFRVDDNMAGTSLDAEDQNGDDLEPIQENDDVNNDNISDDHKTDNDPVNISHNFENNIKIDNNSDFNSNATGDAAEEAERKVIEHSSSAPPEFTRRMTVNLMQVLNQIDDHFLKASQSAHEVSNMLEATRMHYHSNFADNRGYINHSARVMRVITWNKSFKGISSGDGGKDDFDSEEYETHATVLDKLLAWEKKLYEEVKQGELMKLEYQRKVAVLNKQKKRGASAEALEKAKTAVSHLHTRYIVDMQSMDSTVSEVNRLRDEQLYPKLVALVNGMAKMWKTMSIHHDFQLKIVTDLKSLDIANIRETTMQHHERTKQLHKIIQDWHTQFESLISNQKQYIHALSNWLKLNLIPIESSLKEKISSPPRPQHPRIQPLLHSWHDSLEKLPDEIAKSAISSFAAVIKTIMVHQEEEMKLKEKCEETRKEYLRKNQSFEDWYQKYSQRRGPHDEMMDGERGEDGSTSKDPVVERQAVVEGLKKRLEEEVEAHKRYCVQVREKSLGNLKIRLPELFRAMSDYTHTCSDAYEKLRAITQSQNLNRGSQ